MVYLGDVMGTACASCRETRESEATPAERLGDKASVRSQPSDSPLSSPQEYAQWADSRRLAWWRATLPAPAGGHLTERACRGRCAPAARGSATRQRRVCTTLKPEEEGEGTCTVIEAGRSSSASEWTPEVGHTAVIPKPAHCQKGSAVHGSKPATAGEARREWQPAAKDRAGAIASWGTFAHL